MAKVVEEVSRKGDEHEQLHGYEDGRENPGSVNTKGGWEHRMDVANDDNGKAFKDYQPVVGNAQPVEAAAKQRLASLDVFRGMTVALMILVDDTGFAWSKINHSPWNGCTLADLVMPFFLFIVGMAIALALKRVPSAKKAIQRVVLRTIKLILWGIVLQGGFSHAPFPLDYGIDMNYIRWCGILQRIALAYFIVALLEIATKKYLEGATPVGHFGTFTLYKWHWCCAFAILILYLITVYSLYVPDWTFVSIYEGPDFNTTLTVKCGVRGKFDPGCNAVGHIDRTIQGVNHLYQWPEIARARSCSVESPHDGDRPDGAPTWCQEPFEPEGIFSSIAAVVTCFIGLHYGHILVHMKETKDRLIHWGVPSILMLALGLILHYSGAIAMNKQLWSVSYTLFTAGAAGIVFCGFYVLVDVYGIRWPTCWLQWEGMNAMLVFVGGAQGIAAAFINGWYSGSPDNNLTKWILNKVFTNPYHNTGVGVLLYVLFCEQVFWAVVAGLCHWRGWYWTL